MPNRLVMCGLIWDPRPSSSRPRDSSCTSFAWTAMDIGLRANATAIAVPSSMVSVATAASPRARNGSCLISLVHTPA
jgi:hypothetical protein